MSKLLLEDTWAVKCIKYLVRKDYSSQQVIDAMAIIGIAKKIKKEIPSAPDNQAAV